MIDNCYLKLPNLPLLPQEFIDEAVDFEYFFPIGQHPDQPNRLPEAWRPKTRSQFEDTEFCKKLSAEFGEMVAWNYKFPPKENLDWHKDFSRCCCLNFLINDVVDAVTLFRERIEPYRLVQRVEPLKYTLHQAVLFNASVEHTIINYSNQTRYLLSVGFAPGVHFEDVRDYLIKQQISQY
jgi:hypothetical protein